MNTIERLEENIRRGCERAQAPSRKGPIRQLPSGAPQGLDYLHRLLVTHTPLELLCWTFHPLPVSLIEACSEGVRAETAGAGFEEEDVLLLLCQALHSQCVEQEWGPGVLEAGSEVAATALPHLAFRSDGQARCEAEALHILCGDLLAAVQAAASSVLLEQARAELEEGAEAPAAACALPSARQPRHSSGQACTLAAGGRAGGGAWRHSSAAPSAPATSSTDFPSLTALPYLEPAGECRGASQRTAGHLSAAAAAAAAPSSGAPSTQPSGAPLLPQAAALLSQLTCTCSAGLASSQAPHSAACRNGLYSQLSQRTSALAARRAELLRTAAATHRDMARRFAGAAAGVYAERAREVGAEMRATQELASHVMLMANNPGLFARGGSGGTGRRAGTLNLGQALGLAVSSAGSASAAQAEVDLHGQHLREAVALLQDTILPQARAGKVRVLRVITGVGNHSQQGGVLREGVGHFLRGCVGEEGGLGVLRCVAEGSGAFLVHLKA